MLGAGLLAAGIPTWPLYGLGSDQLLSFNLVTADGRFITADPTQNQELFFALRGGGGGMSSLSLPRCPGRASKASAYCLPGTYGIVTSAIVKAYPGGLKLTGASYSFYTGPVNPGNLSSLSPVKPSSPPILIPDTEKFWKAFSLYLGFAPNITSAGGLGFGDLANIGNNTITFVGSFIAPHKTAAETSFHHRPLLRISQESRNQHLGSICLYPSLVSDPNAHPFIPRDISDMRAVLSRHTRGPKIARQTIRCSLSPRLFPTDELGQSLLSLI